MTEDSTTILLNGGDSFTIGGNLGPKNGQEKEQAPIATRSKLAACKKHAQEMHEFVKDKATTHTTLKQMVTKMVGLLKEAEREHNELRARVEKAEKEPEEALKLKVWGPKTVSNRDMLTPKRKLVSTASTPATTKKKRRTHEEWRKVEKKPKKSIGNQEGQRSRGIRQKADALVVGVADGTSYAEILKKVKNDPSLKELGEQVARIRRTQNGEMLFELKRDPAAKSSLFKGLVEKSLGESAKVRALSQEIAVECRNLDEITTEDELREALKAQFELDDVADTAKIRLRKAYGALQIAEIRVPADVAKKLVEAGKVKVGWTVCTLRATERLERCFKCMEFGHQAKFCKGEDRSKCCRKCGELGHIAKDCTKAPKCMLCTENGDHATGGTRCPVFKKALAAKQKQKWR